MIFFLVIQWNIFHLFVLEKTFFVRFDFVDNEFFNEKLKFSSNFMESTERNFHFYQTVDPHRLSIVNNLHISSTTNQRRTSIVNHQQRRNSQLRKTSFTTSILVCRKRIHWFIFFFQKRKKEKKENFLFVSSQFHRLSKENHENLFWH